MGANYNNSGNNQNSDSDCDSSSSKSSSTFAVNRLSQTINESYIKSIRIAFPLSIAAGIGLIVFDLALFKRFRKIGNVNVVYFNTSYTCTYTYTL